MAYVSKQWKDRQVEYPNRRTITHDDLTQEVVSVNRNEGTIYEAGDVLDSVNMNNLESRIAAGLNEKQNTLTAGQGITIENDVISATGGGGGASALVDLTDTDINSPTDKQTLIYDATTQKWKNASGATVELDKVASGSVVSFNDGADDLPVLDLTAQIEPKQASGTPSPSNPLPFSVWTGVNVTRTGKNLLEADMSQDGNNRVILYDNKFLQVGTYALSLTTTNVANFYMKKHSESNWSNVGGYNKTQITITITDADYYDISYYISTGVSASDISNVQIETGTTWTDYEPYNGTTYAVSWQSVAGTVHGGYIDLTTGLLTVTWNKYSARWGDGTGATDLGDNIRKRFSVTDCDPTNRSQSICDSLVWSTSYTADTPHFYIDTSVGVLVIMMPENTSDNTIINVVYPLATPQTYQLTPTEVKTLLGVNNIFADTGDVTVDYRTKTASDIIDVVQPELDKKQDTLTAGTGISIVNNVISATGGGGGTTYTAGDNITIDSNDVISARRVPQNILFGGDDLRVAYKPVLFSESSMEFFGGHGFVIEETGSDSIIYTVEDARLDLGESYTLRLRIDINGTMFEYKIDHISSSVYSTTFTLDGMEFQIGIINVLSDSFVLQNFYSPDKTSQDDLYLVGISLEEETNSELPFNNKDSQITALINKKMESVYYTDTLIAGNTSLVITDDEDILTSDSFIDIYTDEYGTDPTAVSVSLGVTNTITLTFEARQTNLGVKVRVYK